MLCHLDLIMFFGYFMKSFELNRVQIKRLKEKCFLILVIIFLILGTFLASYLPVRKAWSILENRSGKGPATRSTLFRLGASQDQVQALNPLGVALLQLWWGQPLSTTSGWGREGRDPEVGVEVPPFKSYLRTFVSIWWEDFQIKITDMNFELKFDNICLDMEV
jgi:hypothetical protein